MLKAVIVVRPQRAEVLFQRLAALDWCDELTAAECQGYGRQKGHLDSYQGSEYHFDVLPKVMLTAVVPDDRVDALVDVVCSACRTGRIGDGKIFLLPIARTLED